MVKLFHGMSFIEKQEIKNTLNSPILTHDISINIISGLLGWKRANKFYDQVKSYNIQQFIRAYKKKSRIKHIVPQDHIRRIPKNGSLLIIANHPTGIPDGILILDQVLKVRKDVKIIANQLTYKVDPLKPYTIPVDPYDKSESVRQNALQIRAIFDWLEAGHCVILFPSGDVANYNFKEKCLVEQFWHQTARKIILKHKGAVLPWAIQGKNSHLFYQLGKVHPSIKSALLPREGLKIRRKPMYSHIGFPVKIEGKESLLNDLEAKIKFMSLRGPVSTEKILDPQNAFQNPVATTQDPNLIFQEISKIQSVLAEKGCLMVLLTTKKESPNILNEVGRLREITFRSVGEGTGKERDLDHHDEHFDHLILWDKDNKTIAGSYRLGNGVKLKEIKNYKSIIHEFYHENKGTNMILNESLVLGRAFITDLYQQKPFSLFLLWQGIYKYLEFNTEIKYILGQTSISNNFHPFSQKLIVNHLIKNHANLNLSKYFVAKNTFENGSIKMIQDYINTLSCKDFKRLDDMVQNIEMDGQRIPILFRRYIEQNAKVLGINIDPDFQNSIDVLMLTEVER